MPWWIWLILVIFMLAMIIAGTAYAILHAIRAGKTAMQTGITVSEHMAALSQADSSQEDGHPASFTVPLNEVVRRYEDAQARRYERRAAKRDRHVRIWARWSHYND